MSDICVPMSYTSYPMSDLENNPTMSFERINSENENKVINALKASEHSLTYQQLVQVTGLSMATVRRLTEKLDKRRLVKKYSDGKKLFWSAVIGNELPTIGGYSIEEWYLAHFKDQEIFTEEFVLWFKSTIALLYVQPAYKIAAGKTLDTMLNNRRERMLNVASTIDYAINELRFIAHNLYEANEMDYENWLNHKDYDPTSSLQILHEEMPDKFTKPIVDEILKKWSNKKVG